MHNPDAPRPRPHQPDPADCDLCESPAASRREFLTRGRQALTALALSSPMWLPGRSQAARGGSDGDVLIYVFLRGGMDGMSLVVPYADPDYSLLRPTLSLPPPGSGTSGDAIDLDGFFGLNPVAAPLLTPFQDGTLAFVTASGSTNPTRSHFDAMKFLEFGIPDASGLTEKAGFLGRHLREIPGSGSLLRGMALEFAMPYALFEAPDTVPVSDPAALEFPGWEFTRALRREKIEAMYARASDPLKTAGESGVATIDLLDQVDFDGYQEENGAQYGESFFGQRLRKVAAMIKADIGAETYALDVHGWDTHASQGNLSGTFATLISEVAVALEALSLDLQSRLDKVTVCVITEFGRTAAENGSSGTDHGRASTMMVLGGAVDGGKIHGQWPGLAPADLDLGDLAVTTDYRDVMWEILSQRMGATNLDAVFPGHTYQDPDILR